MLNFILDNISTFSQFIFNRNRNSNIGNNKVSFYYLSIIKHKDINNYSIHGLWPQYTTKSFPSYCSNVSFSIEKLNPIIKELNLYWYSTENKNSDFWKHEYEKHGSCMGIKLSEYDYFKKTIDLYKLALNSNIIEQYNDNEDSNKILIPISLDFIIMDKITHV